MGAGSQLLEVFLPFTKSVPFGGRKMCQHCQDKADHSDHRLGGRPFRIEDCVNAAEERLEERIGNEWMPHSLLSVPG
jgi:hypothetical protein